MILPLPVEPYDALRVEYTPRITVGSLGSEYQDRALDGINTNLQKWTITYDKKTNADMTTLYDFLKAHAGCKAFSWVPPGELTARRFICSQFSRTFDYYTRIQTITATFEEVPL